VPDFSKAIRVPSFDVTYCIEKFLCCELDISSIQGCAHAVLNSLASQMIASLAMQF
jgi:hypothetical protein